VDPHALLFRPALYRGQVFRSKSTYWKRSTQCAGLHKTRVAAANRLAEARRAKLSKFISDEDRKAYERDGFVVRRNFLPKSVFEQLLAQIKEHRCTSEERLWGDTINRKTIVDSATTSRMPALKEVLNSPDWRDLIIR
jgi:hypothetical protein